MRTAVYVSCAGQGLIHVFVTDPAEVGDANGPVLRPAQTLELGGALMPMVLGRGGSRLHVVRRSEPFAVLTLAIDGASGCLQPLGEAALPDNMAYASTDATGHFLFTASYGGDRVAVNPIDADGRVGATLQVVPTARHAHAVRPDPAGHHVWVSCLGADRLQRFAFDPRSGRLGEAPDAWLDAPAGSGPRHFVFHPSRPWLFVIGELDGHVDTWAAAAPPVHWRLVHRASLMPEGFAEAPWAGELRLSPDGSVLLASERRSGTLTSFGVEALDGRLTRRDQVATESVPRGMALSPDARFVFAAGQRSEALGVLSLDPVTARLRPIERHAIGAGATWVKTLALPG